MRFSTARVLQFSWQPSRKQISKLIAAVLAFLCWPTSVNATLYVIVLDRREIAIASDSKWLTMSSDSGFATSNGIEKVIPLSSKLAFMSTGLGELSTRRSVVRPPEIARALYSDFLKNKRHNWSIRDLATAFGRVTTERLNRLSNPEKLSISSLLRELGADGGATIEAIFAGLDFDGKLKTETVDFYLSAALPSYAVQNFNWDLNEAIGDESPRLILSGDIDVLKAALRDGLPPVSDLPSFKVWRQAFQTKRLDGAQTAEALVNLAIMHSTPSKTRLIGYPIFVYRLNARDGFKKVRTVPRGKAVSLPH